MQYEQARPVVEARLYAWGDLVEGAPVAPGAKWSDVAAAGRPSTPVSPQEHWVLQHWDAIQDAALIERVLATLGRKERALITYRYRKRYSWGQVAHSLGIKSKRRIYYLRDRALYVYACQMGLLR